MTRAMPKGWRRDRLKDVASLRTEKTKDKSDLVDYLELEDIESWSMKILNKRNTLEVGSAVTLFNAGDVLFGKLRPYLAKVCRPDFNGKCTGEILAIHPIHVDGNFLKYALIDPEMIKKCTEFSYGAKMPRVNWNTQLSTFEISLPPLPEQKRIAAFLDAKCADIDKAIAAKRKQLDCIDEMWRNILYKATTQGLNSARMERTNNARFPEVPCGWKIRRLKRICSMRSGDNLGAADILPDGDYPVYGGNGLRGYYSDFNVSGKFILVGRQGALCGNVHLVEGKFWATEHALITTLYPNLEIRFVAYMMDAMNLNQYASQSAAQPGLAASKILNVETVVPPYSEQCEIANYLDAKRKNLDELKDNLRRQIEVLEQYRKSLIHECVMGERRVG